jgi:putative endonuclease
VDVPRHIRGRHGERLAANFLALRGYTILEWNRRERHDEIDLIAEHEGWLVFVEVKLRGGSSFGGPVLAVNAVKRRRMIRAARAYLAAAGHPERPVRFDVIALTSGDGGRRLIVEQIENAFGLPRWG